MTAAWNDPNDEQRRLLEAKIRAMERMPSRDRGQRSLGHTLALGLSAWSGLALLTLALIDLVKALT